MSRSELAKIPSLTFYKDELTTARRTSPLQQLVCVGKPCKYYQPEVVRCVNIGGSGTDVDWKCEADLPEALRFGKVEVSCEGWARPGDPYVLKGSCSLQYRLVEVPGALRNSKSDSPIFGSKYFSQYDWPTTIFAVLWIGVLFFLAYSFFLSCFQRNNTRPTSRPPPGRRPPSYGSSGAGGGGGGGWFPGDYRAPPPPYSKDPPNSGASGWSNWSPGFWTGAAVGGLANHLWNSNRATRPPPPSSVQYDWERPRTSFWGTPTSSFSRRSTGSRMFEDDDRGEGSSNLGATRRSTTFGGSSVR